MRLVLASAWYPVGVGAYLLRAARRIQKTNPDLQVITVGPTTGARCWSEDFQYPEHAIQPDHRGPAGILEPEPYRRWFQENTPGADLWIDIDGGYFTHCYASGEEPDIGCPHAIVATDPHVGDQGGTWTYERQRKIADFFFCMQRPYCRVPSDHPAWPALEADAMDKYDFFLPYAYDPEVFHPYPDQAMDADVTVLGVPYPKRTLVAQELNRRGFRVLAGMGSVYEKYARDLCRAPVCFIWSLKDDVPCRVFEAAACARAIVVNRSIDAHVKEILPNLRSKWFDDSEPEGFAVACAADAVSAHLSPVILDKTTKEILHERGIANQTAVAGHTWDARLRQIVKTCLGREI